MANGDPIMFKDGCEKIYIYNREADRIEDDEVYEDFITFFEDLPGILGLSEEDDD